MKNIVTVVVITVVAVFAATGLVLRYGVAARTPRTAHAALANVGTQGAPTSKLDQLLAPVALYPDSLLAQMLMCTSDPQQVLVLNNWLKKQTKKGTALQDAALVEGFDASFVAMALFPQVVDWMATRIDWTTELGKTFAADRAAVFDSIQRLRAQAEKSGALKDTPQQDVETKTTSAGQQVIVIEPANPQVVYVPQYDPQVVYVQAPTQTVVVQEDSHTDAAVAGLIGFTAGIAIGAAIDNDYYYGPYGWHGGGYMYNDAWDDYYDHREDAREDWQDHREDMSENRTDRANEARDQRTERTENRSDTRAGTQSERQANRQSGTSQSRTSSTTAQSRTNSATAQTRTTGASTYEARGRTTDSTTTRDRSGGTRSDAFSGYSSGSSTRAASSRGQSSRGGRSGGGGRRR
jgi:hypothetical protein